ncbi:hypothetical protein [Actinacidiphila sp. bgisy167]|uniref:hypothetical protein n=1 Tax=Actinacidiphila sp. bgisy167 TaxID=3413797 RepID=UPI003D75BC16
MPRSAREWLPPGHLCWRVLDVVEELDLSAFENGYRADGQGGAAYPPVTLVALLLYCYSKGIRSSAASSRPAGTMWAAGSSPRTAGSTTPPSRGSSDVIATP